MEKMKRFCIAVVLVAMAVFLGGCGRQSRPVHISSDPSGAVVYLDDKVLGETPFVTTVEQKQGDYNIYIFKAEKQDYKPAKQSFKEQLYHETVGDLIPDKLHFVLEKRKKYNIAITSAPSGAVVTLNGDVLGETPVTATILERIGNPRVFDFVAVKDGYEQSQTVLREFMPKDGGAEFKFPETLHFDMAARTVKQQ